MTANESTTEVLNPTETNLKKSEIGVRWHFLSKLISTYDSISTKDTIENNPHLQRLVFVLSHHQMFIEKAAQNTLNTETEVTCMDELMNILQDYNRSSMMNDFYAIKRMMEEENENENENEMENENNNNSNHKNMNNNQQFNSKTININNSKMNIKNNFANEVRKYFESKLGKCTNFSNCKCFVRNRRPRSSDCITNERRDTFYIRAQDIQKYGNAEHSRFEVREVVLQTSLDVIHNYIFHAEDEQMNVNQSHKNKFVTEVNANKKIDDESKSNDSEMKIAEKLGQYSFGLQTTYWSMKNPYFVLAKYADLKTELTSNVLHAISLFSYEALEEQARDIMQTNYGKKLKCKREHEWMKINGKQLIKKGSLIAERHLIAVLAYTNHDTMQYDFKKKGFRKLNDEESENDVRQRNSEIAHWSRAIFEVIHCWGTVMSRKKPLYHGINCKLLFDRFSHRFHIPTSLTTNVRVAQNFAKGDGIILVLKHARQSDGQSLMFDVSEMSDYPNEQERLIFRSHAQFSDMIMHGCSYKSWITVLRIYERIRLGIFLFNTSFSVKKQAMIVCMIENYLADKNNVEKILQNDENYANGNVPIFIQQLFNECTECYAVFRLNEYSINQTISNVQLLQFLDGSNDGKKSEFLSTFKDLRETHVYEWLVTGDSYVSYFSDEHPWVIDQQIYRINLAQECSSAVKAGISDEEQESLFIEFHWEIQNDMINDVLMCKLVCDSLPLKVKQVKMKLGIFVEETKSEMYSSWFVDHQEMSVSVLNSIVNSNKLRMDSNLDVKQEHFNLKLLFLIYESTNVDFFE